jgi:hypothetical protein
MQKMKTLFASILLLQANAFSPTHTKYGPSSFGMRVSHRSRKSSSLQMAALTPVGPFCPFRSSAAQSMDGGMQQLNSAGPEFATEIARVQSDMKTGQMPDPQRLAKVADGIDEAVNQWESLITRLRLSPDFQTKEYAKLTQAHLETHGVTVESISSMMRWQGGCMRALATNRPPPMPPADLDLQQLMAQAQDASAKPPPSITAMAAAESITANPFHPSSFESETVMEEYLELVRAHSALIDSGAKYDSFDPLGKLEFLDEIEQIEERWDVFFMRFKLMGAINIDYKRQCDQFLASMSMTEDDYRKLLKKCHELMRKDAERQRRNLPQ